MILASLLLYASIAQGASASAPAAELIDTRADSWAATDALGRTLPDFRQAGPARPGKFVGVFYFLWMGPHGTDGPYDIPKIIAQDPDAMRKPASPLWGPIGHMHHWGEPLFGYYLSDDAWVLAKHAQMLGDAGVDTIIFDVTNQITYQKVYMRLCEVYTQVRRNGGRTPQIAFLTPFGDCSKVVAELYANLYKPGKYSELWFQWKGKPLIMADPARSPAETRDFFTFRKPQPDYFQGPTGPDQWGWLEIYPQHAFYNAAGKPEQVTVGIGQNGHGKRLCAFSEKDTYGRSWHDGKKDERPDAVNYGYNVAEQWKRAFEIDPEFVFFTSWNEWVAGRFPEFAGVREPVMFVDEYTQEYSRDAEPMKGGHGDNYYYQLINYIRRFKGVRPPPARSGPRTIQIDGSFAEWNDVRPEYRDDAGDTLHRDHPGYDKAGRYVNTSGRNDFTLLKAARDLQFVYFYAKTAEPITSRPVEGPAAPDGASGNWMTLLIDADNNSRTGWCGYDFIVNRISKDDSTAVVEASDHAARWNPVGSSPYRVRGNEMELAVPRAILGLSGASADVEIQFKWIDNVRFPDHEGFLTDGDTAPNARFNYIFADSLHK